MDEHNAAVISIAGRIRQFHDKGEKFRIYHGHTNSTRSVHRTLDNTVDTSSLRNVLSVDVASKTALVEPNVCMEALVEAALRFQLLPQIVPEFRGITVGGAFAGTAGESSSFKYGIFDSSVNGIEIVLADGTIVNASINENADLMYGSAGACGTLGVVTLLELQLIDAQPFVQLEYHPVYSASQAMDYLRDVSDREPTGPVDFVDGILFSANSGVILTGTLVSSPRSGTSTYRFTRAHDQHFYRHVEKTLAQIFRRQGDAKMLYSEAIPIRDYLFRYDRGCFWGAKRAFKYFRVPFNRVSRWFLDLFMSSKVMFHAMHESGLADRAIIQDVAVPIDHTAEFVDYSDKILNCYPLWLCPLRPTSAASASKRGRTTGMGKRAAMDDLFCNVGVWLMAPTKTHEEFVALNRDIEQRVHALDGLKTLYAHTYYTKDEFWDVYDREQYDTLRSKYRATTLPDLYEKVAVRPKPSALAGSGSQRLLRALHASLWNIWPFSGLYGVWRVIVSKEYLLKKRE